MYYIGVDVGGMSLKAGISDGSETIIAKKVIPTRARDGYEAVLSDLVSLITGICSENDIPMEKVGGVGLGIPGTVFEGVVTKASNLYWLNVPLAEDLKKRLALPVAIDNDANCAAYAEYRFGDVKAQNILHLTIGTGIGTGIIINGKMLTGHKGFGGEGGHIVIKKEGRKCPCGRSGCFEQYASASALLRNTREAITREPASILARVGKNGVDGHTIFEAVKQGCPLAKELLASYIEDIACGIASIINIVSPEVVLIGGGVSAEEELLVSPLELAVNKEIYGGNTSSGIRVPVRRAKFGNDAGIVGAVSIAMSV